MEFKEYFTTLKVKDVKMVQDVNAEDFVITFTFENNDTKIGIRATKIQIISELKPNEYTEALQD
jgi:hypothetical protein